MRIKDKLMNLILLKKIIIYISIITLFLFILIFIINILLLKSTYDGGYVLTLKDHLIYKIPILRKEKRFITSKYADYHPIVAPNKIMFIFNRCIETNSEYICQYILYNLKNNSQKIILEYNAYKSLSLEDKQALTPICWSENNKGIYFYSMKDNLYYYNLKKSSFNFINPSINKTDLSFKYISIISNRYIISEIIYRKSGRLLKKSDIIKYDLKTKKQKKLISSYYNGVYSSRLNTDRTKLLIYNKKNIQILNLNNLKNIKTIYHYKKCDLYSDLLNYFTGEYYYIKFHNEYEQPLRFDWSPDNKYIIIETKDFIEHHSNLYLYNVEKDKIKKIDTTIGNMGFTWLNNIEILISTEVDPLFENTVNNIYIRTIN